LASVLEGKGNHTGAIHHLKQVLTVDPDFLEDGSVEKYLLAVSCHLKFSTSVCATSTQEGPEVSGFFFFLHVIMNRFLQRGLENYYGRK
jgi:hypothetical protein